MEKKIEWKHPPHKVGEEPRPLLTEEDKEELKRPTVTHKEKAKRRKRTKTAKASQRKQRKKKK